MPGPNDDQCPVDRSQTAMAFATALPATVKFPPTTNRGGAGPAPSGSQVIATLMFPFAPASPSPGSHCVEHCAREAAGNHAETSSTNNAMERAGIGSSLGMGWTGG